MISPTGVLEYYWCWTNATLLDSGSPSDCCVNDLPTVAGITKLLQMLLTVLPTNISTPEQRTEWMSLLSLLPPLPTARDPANSSRVLLAPAEVMCTVGSNPVSGARPVSNLLLHQPAIQLFAFGWLFMHTHLVLSISASLCLIG